MNKGFFSRVRATKSKTVCRSLCLEGDEGPKGDDRDDRDKKSRVFFIIAVFFTVNANVAAEIQAGHVTRKYKDTSWLFIQASIYLIFPLFQNQDDKI